MIPPQNLEAEESTIGAVLVRPAEVSKVLDTGLVAKHFYRDTHRAIWRAILALRKRGEDIDALTVSIELERRGGLEGKDAKGYVHELAGTVPVAAHAATYARSVVHDALRRDVYEKAQPLRDGTTDLNGNAGGLMEALANLQAFEADRPGDGVRAAPLASVKRERVEWLWPERVPLGMLTLLSGDPGLGKSLLTLMIAAQVSRDGGDVLILSAEDHAGATIRPRAEAAGADLERLHVVTVRRDGMDEGIALPDDAPKLERMVAQTGARLVVVDPLMAHLPESVNSWRDQSVRRALAPLHRIAEAHGCAVLLVAHLNKARGGDALYRTGGSIGIPAAVRSALLLAREPSDEERGSRRVLAHVKCNVGEQAESLACQVEPILLDGDERITTARLRVTGTSETTASDLLEAPSSEERTERDEAMDCMRAELSAGPRSPKDVRRAVKDAVGCSDRTIDRAKHDLGVKSRREGFGPGSRVLWEVPESDSIDRQGIDRHSYISPVASYEGNGITEPNVGAADSIDRHGSDMAVNEDGAA